MPLPKSPPPPPSKPTPPSAVSPPKPASTRPPISGPPPTATKGSPASRHIPKKFEVQTWSDKTEGTKVLVYANSGMGKSTLGLLAPDPVFIGLDDGGRKLRHPTTGAEVQAILGIETFRDLRDAIQQPGLIKPGQTLVIDTITRAEILVEHDCFANIKNDRGETVSSVEAYGYGKGNKHVLDTMRLLIGDCEPLVRRGVHILLLAQQSQATVSNLEGIDYAQDGPKLNATKQYNTRTEFCEWVDYVFQIGHPELTVVVDNVKAKKGKVKGTMERVIYTSPALHRLAKSRPVNGRPIPPVVSFEHQADDSIWQYLFHGAVYDPATA